MFLNKIKYTSGCYVENRHIEGARHIDGNQLGSNWRVQVREDDDDDWTKILVKIERGG